jgi:flagellar biosynthesis chaperone FliJ
LLDRLRKESQIAEAEHFAYQVQVETLQKLVDEQRERIKILTLQLENEMKNYAKEKKNLDVELKSVGLRTV